MTPAKRNDPKLEPQGRPTRSGSVTPAPQGRPTRSGSVTPAPQGRPSRSGSAWRQLAWILVPLVSLGFLSCVPFLGYALIQRRRRDWAVFAAYLAATAGLIAAVSTTKVQSGARTVVFDFLALLAIFAAVHAGVLFRPPASLSPTGLPGMRRRNQDAVAEAEGRIKRRKEARHLAEHDPALAREMRIGRPDLPRDYDDGGLVDVNHVPEAVLTGQLGMTAHEVSAVMSARSQLGRFSSADELCAYTDLSPDRVDELRDLMIFT